MRHLRDTVAFRLQNPRHVLGAWAESAQGAAANAWAKVLRLHDAGALSGSSAGYGTFIAFQVILARVGSVAGRHRATEAVSTVYEAAMLRLHDTYAFSFNVLKTDSFYGQLTCPLC